MRQFATTIVSSLCLAFTAGSQADVVDLLALDGEAAPGGGVYTIASHLVSGSLQGQYATFSARKSTAGFTMVLLSDRQTASLDIVFQGGDAVDSSHIIKSNGGLEGLGGPVSNSSGAVVSHATNVLSTNGNATKLDLLEGGVAGYNSSIVSQDDVAPNSNGSLQAETSFTPAINASGQVAASVRLFATSGGATDDEAIYRWNSAALPLTKIVRKGDSLPSGPGTFTGTTFQSNEVFAAPFINSSGNIAFVGGVNGGVAGENSGIFVSDGSLISDYVRYNDNLPHAKVFSSVSAIDFNDTDQVGFSANWQGTSSTLDGVYRADGSTITELGAVGQSSPNGFPYRLFQAAVKIANDGNAIFSGSLTETGGIQQAVFVGDGSTTTQLARTTSPAPEGRGDFTSFSKWAISRGGKIAFQATTTLSGYNGIFSRNSAGDIFEVVSTEDQIDGSAIALLSLRGDDFGQSVGVNDDGDVLFGFRLADGRDGVAVWRVTASETVEGVSVPMVPQFGILIFFMLVSLIGSRGLPVKPEAN